MVKKESKLTGYIVLAVIVVGAIYLMGGSQQAGNTLVLPAANVNNQPAPVATAEPVADTFSHTGTLDITPLSRLSTTYTGASKMTLLDPATHWKSDEVSTKYEVMRIYQEGGGIDGLTGAFGIARPEEKSVASGKYTYSSINAKIGDQFVIFTYQDTSPAAGENESNTFLAKLTNFEPGTGNWAWEIISDGSYKGKVSWPMYNLANYNFVDSAFNASVTNYTYGDGGSVDVDRTFTWYTNATNQGEECVDCVIYLTMPKNFTGKFKSLTISDGTKSHKFTTLSKAYDLSTPIKHSVISTISGIASPISTDELFVPVSSDGSYGYIGDLNTRRTSDSEHRLIWDLKTDTYGTDVLGTFYIVEYGKSVISTNIPHVSKTFGLRMTNGAAQGFDADADLD